MKGNNSKKLLLVLIGISLLILISGCSNKQEDAREKLAKMNIEYTNDGLITAIKNGDETICQLFADSGMNIKEIKIDNNRTLLWVAVNAKQTKMIDCLLKNGVDLEAKDSKGETVTYYVAYYFNSNNPQDLELLKYLINKGAKMDVINNAGMSMVVNANVSRNTKEKIKALIDAGAPDDREEFFAKNKAKLDANAKQKSAPQNEAIFSYGRLRMTNFKTRFDPDHTFIKVKMTIENISNQDVSLTPNSNFFVRYQGNNLAVKATGVFATELLPGDTVEWELSFNSDKMQLYQLFYRNEISGESECIMNVR